MFIDFSKMPIPINRLCITTVQLLADQLTPSAWCGANVENIGKVNVKLIEYFSDLIRFKWEWQTLVISQFLSLYDFRLLGQTLLLTSHFNHSCDLSDSDSFEPLPNLPKKRLSAAITRQHSIPPVLDDDTVRASCP